MANEAREKDVWTRWKDEKAQAKLHQKAFYLDIEAQGWTTFVVGALLCPDGETRVETDEEALVDAILARCKGATVWAHAAGRYDGLWLLRAVHARGIPWYTQDAGSQVVSITIGSGKDRITVRDTFRLWPISLAKIGSYLGRAKLDLPASIQCTCGRCAGYCAITRAHAKVLTPYLIRDVELVRDVHRWLVDLAARHGIQLGTTIGGTAWKDARALLDLPRADKELSLGQDAFLRRAYFGGRTECYRTRAPTGHSADLHSAYPWALGTVPVPVRAPTIERGGTLDERPAILQCSVTVPECDVPPLPVRDDERILYPWGALDGVWTSSELRHAVACGATIERVTASATWSKADMVSFAPWLESRARLREHYGYASAEGAWLKWLVNSLTGKLAQRPQVQRVVVGEPACVCKLDRCECREALDPRGTIWSEKRRRVSPSGHVAAAAFLTAHVRVELHTQIASVGEARVYTDTDSLYATSPIERRIGDAVGDWGDEGAWSDWECWAPKVYRCRRPGKATERAKGVPLRLASDFNSYTRGAGVPIEGPRGLRGALRRGRIFEAMRQVRVLRAEGPWIGSRVKLPDGNTRAASIDEWRART